MPLIIVDAWNPASRANYVEVGATSADVARSFVQGFDEGAWRGYGADPSSHEFGHTLGLDDHCTDALGADPGWSGNTMAEPAGQGVFQQRNINELVGGLVGGYVAAGSPAGVLKEINP